MPRSTRRLAAALALLTTAVLATTGCDRRASDPAMPSTTTPSTSPSTTTPSTSPSTTLPSTAPDAPASAASS